MWMLINLKDLICASRCDLWHPIRYFSILLPRRLNQSCSVVKQSPITKFSPVDRPTGWKSVHLNVSILEASAKETNETFLLGQGEGGRLGFLPP